MLDPCRLPVSIPKVLDEPELVRTLLEETAPHYPVQRYFRSAAEMRTQSGPLAKRPMDAEPGAMIIAPNFRGDWATPETQVPGVLPFLENPYFVAAAAKLFESDLVRPWGVYSNITWQLPFHQGAGHTDVPSFLGVDRSEYPTWFLNAMGHSGLFEAERIDIATAVSWFYLGNDGGFTYWPDGPDAPPHVHEGHIYNTAFVGDNDRMYHRVRPVGDPREGLPAGLTLESRLVHERGDAWAIRTNGAVMAEMHFSALRISVSWKAHVYRDREQLRRHEEGIGGLSLDSAVTRFADDLRARRVEFEVPSDPLHEERFVDVLGRTYVAAPTVFEA